MSGWRVVVISSRSRLELKLNHLVVRNIDCVRRVHLKEIDVLVVENTGTTLSVALLEALWQNKINVVFCDSKHLPAAQLVTLYGAHDCAARLKDQLSWSTEAKDAVWAYIIKSKIAKQAESLFHFELPEAWQLLEYVEDVLSGDLTNREGMAAKVFFNALFGHGFFRSVDSKLNSALDYGYSIILSTVAREIVASGCITQLGIFHHNTFNSYNLASDLMEPFRPLVDLAVHDFSPEDAILSAEEKRILINVLNMPIRIDGTKTTVLNGIRVYVRSVIDALSCGDVTRIRMYDYEF